MSPTVKRLIVTAWVILAASTVTYFTYKSPSPLIRVGAIFGGFGFMFIFIKVYLFRS